MYRIYLFTNMLVVYIMDALSVGCSLTWNHWSINNKPLEHWFSQVLSGVAINDLENFVGVELSFQFLVFNFFFLLVPVPFVDLTCFKTSFFGKFFHVWSVPC